MGFTVSAKPRSHLYFTHDCVAAKSHFSRSLLEWRGIKQLSRKWPSSVEIEMREMKAPSFDNNYNNFVI